MLFVCGISESVQEVVKSGDSSTIFRRAGAFAARADGISCAWVGRQALLQDDGVLPTVAHIIRIDDLGTDSAEYAGESQHALILDRRHSHEPVLPIGLAEMPV